MSKPKKKRKTSTRAYDPASLEEEGEGDYEEGLAYLKRFQSEHFGRLTLHLEKAAIHFKMAVKRWNYAEHLKGNTLEEYVKEDKKK